MKNINLVLNVISIAAIAVLFYFVLNNSNSKPNDQQTNTKKGDESSSVSPINKDSLTINLAYVNLDTIKEYYYYYSQLEDEFDKITNQARQGLASKEKELKSKMENIESKVMLNMKTQEEAQQEAYNLQLEYESFLQDQQSRLSKMEAQYFSTYLDSLKYHVKLFNKSAGFDYIITHNSSTSSLLYASPKLDVTRLVLESMNKSGKKEEE